MDDACRGESNSSKFPKLDSSKRIQKNRLIVDCQVSPLELYVKWIEQERVKWHGHTFTLLCTLHIYESYMLLFFCESRVRFFFCAATRSQV